MTTRINLLPWRDERRRLREREFYTMLGGAAIVGALGVIMWSTITGAAVDNQGARNTYLGAEITEMDKRIAQIKELDKTKARLVGRKNAIELLQANRAQMVHIFDELVITIPDGVRLTALKQVGEQLTLDGIAESNTRVANYMRNIDRSPWMGRSEVSRIENRTGLVDSDPRLPYKFSLGVRLLKAGEQKSPEDIAASAAAADLAEGVKLAPGDMQVIPAKPGDPASTAPASTIPANMTPASTRPGDSTVTPTGTPDAIPPVAPPPSAAPANNATTPAPAQATPAATTPPTDAADAAPTDNPPQPIAPVPVQKPAAEPAKQEPSR